MFCSCFREVSVSSFSFKFQFETVVNKKLEFQFCFSFQKKREGSLKSDGRGAMINMWSVETRLKLAFDFNTILLGRLIF